jgi:hypothetical protein
MTSPRSVRIVLGLASLTMAAAPLARAGMACPVMLVSGEFNQDSVSLTIRNIGKLPIRQFELYCASPQGNVLRRSTCHAEAAVFYPGTPYDINFAYPAKKSGLIVISLKAAQLSDGSMWMAAQDQACRSIKIHASKS